MRCSMLQDIWQKSRSRELGWRVTDSRNAAATVRCHAHDDAPMPGLSATPLARSFDLGACPQSTALSGRVGTAAEQAAHLCQVGHAVEPIGRPAAGSQAARQRRVPARCKQVRAAGDPAKSMRLTG